MISKQQLVTFLGIALFVTLGTAAMRLPQNSTKRPEYLNVVSCITCHRGDPMPADLK